VFLKNLTEAKKHFLALLCFSRTGRVFMCVANNVCERNSCFAGNFESDGQYFRMIARLAAVFFGEPSGLRDLRSGDPFKMGIFGKIAYTCSRLMYRQAICRWSVPGSTSEAQKLGPYNAPAKLGALQCRIAFRRLKICAMYKCVVAHVNCEHDEVQLNTNLLGSI